jgi:hypothetical protein
MTYIDSFPTQNMHIVRHSFYQRLILSALFVLIAAGLSAQKSHIPLAPEKSRSEVKSDNIHSTRLFFSFDKLHVGENKTEYGTFTELNLDRGYAEGTLGEPRLPAEKRLIEIPFGAEVQIKIHSYTTEEYLLPEHGIKHRLMPLQPSLRKDIAHEKAVFEYLPERYNQSGWVEQELASIEVLGTLRGMRLARLTIAPMSYDPAGKKIRVYNNIELELIYTDADPAKTNKIKAATYSPWFDVIYAQAFNAEEQKDVFENHPDLTKYPVKMLVVSHPDFEETLQPFLAWQAQKGFDVTTAYTNVIGNTPAAIKEYIHAQYHAATPEDPAPTFLVLVGDSDKLPASAIGSSSNHVTDLYYASVDGDYFPDMYYGRLSARNNQELKNQIDKILYYQQYLFDDPSYLNDVTLIAGWDATWNPRIGQPTLHYGINNYFNEEHGFSSVNAYFNSYTGCYDDDKITVSLINFTAHCNVTLWSSPNFTVSDVHSLTNVGQYPLAIGNCCMSGQFSHSESIAEAWLRAENKGAVAYIGSAPNTYWFEDFYWSVGAFPLQGNNESGYVPSFEETTLGAYDAPFVSDYVSVDAMKFTGNLAVTEVDVANYPSHSSPLYYWQAYHTFGDPSTVIYLTEGQENEVSHLDYLPIGHQQYTVRALPGSYVGISMNGVLHGAAMTGESGEVVVPIQPVLAAGDVRIVVTKPQHIPYIADIPAVALEGPYVVLQEFVIDDGSGNNNQQADFGENISLTITLVNVGDEATGEVEVTLVGEDDFVVPQNADTAFTFEGMGPLGQENNTSTKGNTFAFQIADHVPDRHQANFTVKTSYGDHNWETPLRIRVNAPVLSFHKLILADEQISTLGPGETAELSVTVTNHGHATSLAGEAFLQTESPWLSVNQAGVLPVPPLEAGSSDILLFSVTAHEDTPEEQEVMLHFGIQTGGYLFEKEMAFTLALIPEFLMGEASEAISCRGRFFDSGGAAGNYSDNENIIMTFYPEKEGKMLVFEFLAFDVESHSSCIWDRLMIYDGVDNSAPQIGGRYCGTTSPGVVKATNPQGALTFHFISDGSVTRAGWEALFHCIDGDETYTLTFRINDKSGASVSGAVITIDEITYPAGQYVMEDMHVGLYEYKVVREYFYDFSGEVRIDHADTTVDVELDKDVTDVHARPETSLHIFPNPARTHVRIEASEAMRVVRLIDILGNVIQQHTPAGLFQELEVSQVPNGIYMIQVITETGSTTSRVQVRR